MATQEPADGRTVIYDIGANTGDDIPYYLKKADLVVAVEANPVLATAIEQRFADAIAAGRLAVVAKVLATDGASGEVPFFVHNRDHVLSQFPEPTDPAAFDRRILPACSVPELFARFGPPHYVKIDVEGYDETILRALFAAGIRPPFISAEAHDVGVFAVLLAIGGYNAFKLVDGRTVPERYRDHSVRTRDGGVERIAFPAHAAGPFGDDVAGGWLSPDHFLRLLAAEEFGWKDIHATRVRAPDPAAAMNLRQLGAKVLRKWARRRIGTLTPLRADHPIKQFLDV